MSRSPEDRPHYYRAAADFCYSATDVQRQRCLLRDVDLGIRRTDLSFFIVATQRLREVARMLRDRARVAAADMVLSEFDREWPRLKELRDHEEHILGPGVSPPNGIWYFGEFAADLKAGGDIEYVVHAERMMPAITRLYVGICALIPNMPQETQP
jgi:hypothetical protein